MIIYITKKTTERYKLKMPEELSSPTKELVSGVLEKEAGDRLLEWGAKLFYFNRRKCLQVANFASKLTLFLIDVKVGDLQDLGNMMAYYIYDIYKDDPEMMKLLDRFFKEYPVFVVSRLKDKSSIAHLNHVQFDFAADGYRFYDFVEDGVLQTKKINIFFNTDYILTQTINGKKDYGFAANFFKELLKERYLGN